MLENIMPSKGYPLHHVVNSSTIPQDGLQSALLAINSTMTATNKNIMAMEDGFNKKFEELSATVTGSITGLRTEMNDKIDNINSRVEINNLKLSRKCEELSARLEVIEWQNHLNDVVIVGVPFAKGEKLHEILEDLFQKVNYNHGLLSVNSFFRTKSSGNRSGIIIVKFASLGYKKQFFSCIKSCKGKLTTACLGFAFNGPIYVNDSLDKRNAEFFKMTRLLVKAKSIFKSFTMNGHVYIKAWDGGGIHKVNSVAQLKLLDITGVLETKIERNGPFTGPTRD